MALTSKMKHLTIFLLYVCVLTVVTSATPLELEKHSEHWSWFWQPRVCTQVVVCCKYWWSRTVTQEGNACICRDKGGISLGYDLSQCPSGGANVAQTQTPTPTPDGGGGVGCAQVLVCCEDNDGTVRQAGSPCACTESGGTDLGSDLSQCPNTATPSPTPSPTLTGGDGSGEACPQVVVCCKNKSGAVTQEGSPCICRDSGGTSLGGDLAQCPIEPQFCLQVITCCTAENGTVRQVPNSCGCRSDEKRKACTGDIV